MCGAVLVNVNVGNRTKTVNSCTHENRFEKQTSFFFYFLSYCQAAGKGLEKVDGVSRNGYFVSMIDVVVCVCSSYKEQQYCSSSHSNLV